MCTYTISCKILDSCDIRVNGLGFGGSYLFMQLPVLFVFCAITLQVATFFSSMISRWAKYLCTSLWSWFFHVSLFLWWCSHVCSCCIVHTFPPLCHFLCVDIRIGKANVTKLKGAQNWHFLQMSKTISLNLRLQLFLLFTFFYFLVVLWLVVMLPFVLSSM